MNNEDKRLVDKFLDTYENINNKNSNIRYVKIYQRPSKFRAIVGFIFSLILLIILMRLFVLKVIYFMILLVDLCVVAYYGLNLFTKKGIGLPKTIAVKEDEKELDEKED